MGYFLNREIFSRIRASLLKDKLVWIVIIFSLLIASQYLLPGLPQTDDATLMVIRASGFHESFMDGHLPVRWIQRLNENYGYPVMNFLYPLPFYFAEVFQLSSFSALWSIKLVFVSATVISLVGMYMFAKKRFNPQIALVMTVVYGVIPYRIIDMYQRGSLGEVVALASFSWLLFFFTTHKQDCHPASWLKIVTSWAALIVSHNSVGLILSLVVSLWLMVDSQGKLIERIKFLVASAGVAAMLSCFFWLPALYDLQFTRANDVQISQLAQHFSTISSLLKQIGILGLVSLIAGIFYIRKNRQLLVLLSTLIIGIVFQLSFTQPVWEFLNLDTLIQFPIRLHIITVVLVPIIVGLLLQQVHKIVKYIMYGSIVVSVLVSLFTISQVQRQQFDPNYFLTNFDSSTNQKEFTPKDVEVDPQTYATQPFEVITAQDERYQIIETHTKTQETYININPSSTATIIFNRHYFPGWSVYVDDEKVQPSLDDRGRPNITIEPAQRRNPSRIVEITWEETPIRNLANTVSLITGFIIVSILIYYLTRKNSNTTVGIISLLIVFCSLGIVVLSRSDQIAQTFDPRYQEQKYLKSQWVDPQSIEPLGDHGLYLWAGWAYLHGADPTSINPEMPPHGKYVIGLITYLTMKPALVGLTFTLFSLVSLWLLTYQVLENKWLATVPLGLLSLEPIFRSSITYTMLDSFQLGFLCLTFWALLKTEKNNKWFIPAGLFLGIVLSSKFYMSGLLVITSIGLFYLITFRFRQLKFYLFSLILTFSVHAAGYWRYFLNGHNLRDYLGVQKWIYHFYQAGSPSVPFGSYWRLVLLNQWRVWWGPKPGEYYVLPTTEWTLLWPFQTLAVLGLFLTQAYTYLKKLLQKKKTKVPSTYLLLSWLVVYASFLTLIGGWPHYMLLFLPFSSILIVWKLQQHGKTLRDGVIHTLKIKK